MYGTCNQLFSCSRFASYEDRRIAWRDFGDARENIFQSGRCSNDLFKHRGFVDFFTQSNVFAMKSVFGLLAILNVGTRRIPTRNLSLVVAQWVITGQEPAVTSVPFAHAQLQLETAAARRSTIHISIEWSGIFRVNFSTGTLLPPLIKSSAEVFEPDAVYIETFAVGTE